VQQVQGGVHVPSHVQDLDLPRQLPVLLPQDVMPPPGPGQPLYRKSYSMHSPGRATGVLPAAACLLLPAA
jgi:hypothetical protein